MTAPRVNLRGLRAAARRSEMLTTTEASALTGYATDHISLLLRRVELSGKRKGRDWFVMAAALLRYVEEKPRPGPRPS